MGTQGLVISTPTSSSGDETRALAEGTIERTIDERVQLGETLNVDDLSFDESWLWNNSPVGGEAEAWFDDTSISGLDFGVEPTSTVTQHQPPSNTVQSAGLYLAAAAPHPVSPFADYAISTPGVAGLCAKVEIFNHMFGSDHPFDPWDLQSVSPICSGFQVRSCPDNFKPSPLQLQVAHPIVIDLLPWPSLRDRFLYTMSLPVSLRPGIARQEMSAVVLELILAMKDAGGGLRISGSNAFLAEHWEVGPVFFAKFWWAMDAGVFRRSNQLRALRGESSLHIGFITSRLEAER